MDTTTMQNKRRQSRLGWLRRVLGDMMDSVAGAEVTPPLRDYPTGRDHR